jgi:hypothetical protein
MALSKNLLAYAEWLQTVQHLIRQDTPAELNVKTLWIPYSSNRSITIDLNHQVEIDERQGKLWGYNGNCGSPYEIWEIPMEIGEAELKQGMELWKAKIGHYPTPAESEAFVLFLKAEFTTHII